jgi:RNA polymerase sigma-70 factor (ECF subfamily)
VTSDPYVFNSGYVQALSQGDPAIEAHFVQHFNSILLRTLRSKVRSADQARDLCQETFLRVLVIIRSGREVHQPERFEAFVIGVCNNIVRESYRMQNRFVALSTLEIDPVADFPSAFSLVLAQETRSRVRRSLAQLNAGERAILEAVLSDEYDKDEICHRLGVSRSYLRVLLYRAKKQLRMGVRRDTHRAARRNRSRRLHAAAVLGLR